MPRPGGSVGSASKNWADLLGADEDSSKNGAFSAGQNRFDTIQYLFDTRAAGTDGLGNRPRGTQGATR